MAEEKKSPGETPRAEEKPSVVEQVVEKVKEAVKPEPPAKKAHPQTGDLVPCSQCGQDALVGRHTPDFGTHYTVVCPYCHHREKLAD